MLNTHNLAIKVAEALKIIPTWILIEMRINMEISKFTSFLGIQVELFSKPRSRFHFLTQLFLLKISINLPKSLKRAFKINKKVLFAFWWIKIEMEMEMKMWWSEQCFIPLNESFCWARFACGYEFSKEFTTFSWVFRWKCLKFTFKIKKNSFLFFFWTHENNGLVTLSNFYSRNLCLLE